MDFRCGKCGMALNDGAKFCPGCGNQLETPTVTSAPATPTVQVFVGVGPGVVANNSASGNSVPLERSPQTRGTFMALAILLGFLGIHNFYIGKTGLGVTKLLITILSCGSLFWISWIWAGVEILILETDAQGRKLL